MKTPDKKIRVLVVDDSAFMCKVLQEIINSDPQLEVVGQGRDGRDGVALAESLRPDVITMDINMPHVDGLQATELIMTQHPRPIVIVSSESREGAASTLKALELGAIDFVPKPTSGIDLDMKSVREELTRKLKLAAKVRVVRTASRTRTADGRARRSPAPRLIAARLLRLSQNGGKIPMVVIAASTGGPAAVTRVVSGLPKDLPAAVFLVLHMPGAFTKQFTHAAGGSDVPAREGGRAQRDASSGDDLSLPRLASSPAFVRRENFARFRPAHRGLSSLRRRRAGNDCFVRARDDSRRRPHRHGQ